MARAGSLRALVAIARSMRQVGGLRESAASVHLEGRVNQSLSRADCTAGVLTTAGSATGLLGRHPSGSPRASPGGRISGRSGKSSCTCCQMRSHSKRRWTQRRRRNANNGMVEVYVSATGVGIALEDREDGRSRISPGGDGGQESRGLAQMVQGRSLDGRWGYRVSGL